MEVLLVDILFIFQLLILKCYLINYYLRMLENVLNSRAKLSDLFTKGQNNFVYHVFFSQIFKFVLLWVHDNAIKTEI